MKDMEIRLGTAEVETRGENAAPVVRGYAAVFNQWSGNLGGFVEQIAPGAFEGRLADDVFAYLNHDPSKAVGRNGANLRLSVDNVGLRYELDPPDTNEGRDLVENLRAGIITKSSFGFTVEADEWERAQERGEPARRTVTRIGRLFEVSPLTMAPETCCLVGRVTCNHRNEPSSTWQ